MDTWANVRDEVLMVSALRSKSLSPRDDRKTDKENSHKRFMVKTRIDGCFASLMAESISLHVAAYPNQTICVQLHPLVCSLQRVDYIHLLCQPLAQTPK